jgi:hypothetical protein
MAKISVFGGASNKFEERRNPPTQADALRELGKLGPYEEEEVLTECAGCTTKYAADLEACPNCGSAEKIGEATGVERTEIQVDGEWQDVTEFVDTDEVYPEQVSPYEGWLLADLQEECVQRGLPKSGNKPDLVQRLLDDDAKNVEEASEEPAEQ